VQYDVHFRYSTPVTLTWALVPFEALLKAALGAILQARTHAVASKITKIKIKNKQRGLEGTGRAAQTRGTVGIMSNMRMKNDIFRNVATRFWKRQDASLSLLRVLHGEEGQ